MRLPKTVRPGTLVDCIVRGRAFQATVLERTPEGLRIQPPYNCSHHYIDAIDVKKIHRWDPNMTQIRT